MPNDPPFDPNNTWWPNPGWPRPSPPGGPANPDYWTDPFINPNPFAPAAPAPFSAAHLGAMAWHPPIFPGDWTSFPTSTFPVPGLSPPIPPAASPWPNPQSSFRPPAPLSSPDTPSDDRPSPFVSLSSIDNIGGLFSRDPSIPYGLFPYPFDTSPGPTSRFGGGPSVAGGPAGSAPTPEMRGAFPVPGWPPAESFLPPFPPLPNPFAVGSTAPSSSSGPASGPNGSAPPPAPPRSVLFNQPQPSWDFDSALIARQRAGAALDAGAQELGAGELPRAKSGAPYAPWNFSPAPPPSLRPTQWPGVVARLLAPNLIDYYTKSPPAPPPFPSSPAKIPSIDSNPYAPGALLDEVNLAILAAAVLSGGEATPLALARFAGKTGTAASAAELAALSARAKQIHSVLDKIAQRQRTTAVLSTDGDTIIAGGGRDLSPGQTGLLRNAENAGKLPGMHAEITALNEAEKAGLTPRAMATTRRICGKCQAAIEDRNGVLTSSTTAIFPPPR